MHYFLVDLMIVTVAVVWTLSNYVMLLVAEVPFQIQTTLFG